jgi:hypothetical protein
VNRGSVIQFRKSVQSLLNQWFLNHAIDSVDSTNSVGLMHLREYTAALHSMVQNVELRVTPSCGSCGKAFNFGIRAPQMRSAAMGAPRLSDNIQLNGNVYHLSYTWRSSLFDIPRYTGEQSWGVAYMLVPVLHHSSTSKGRW